MKRQANSRAELYRIIAHGSTIVKPYLYAEIIASSDYKAWRAKDEQRKLYDTAAFLVDIGAAQTVRQAVQGLISPCSV